MHISVLSMVSFFMKKPNVALLDTGPHIKASLYAMHMTKNLCQLGSDGNHSKGTYTYDVHSGFGSPKRI